MSTIAFRLNDRYLTMADQFERAYIQATSSRSGPAKERKLWNLVTRYHQLERAYAQAARSLRDRGYATRVQLLDQRHAFIRRLFRPVLSRSPSRTSQRRPSPSADRGSNIVAFPEVREQDRIALAGLLQEEASLEGWGDRLMEAEWITIDGFGTIRNCMATKAAFAGASTPAWIVAGIPLMQVFGGLLCIHSAIRDTIPGSWQELKKAIRLGEREGKVVAGISLANQIMFAGIGAALGAAGVVGMMSPTVANLLGYAPALSQAATTAADVAITGIWGVTCLIRGGLMVGRGLYNLSYLTPFQNKFKEAIKAKDDPREKIEAGLQVLEEEWGDGSEQKIEHFKRRVGAEAATKMEDYMKNKDSYTIKQKLELLSMVDKGVDKQKFKQWLIILIGILMIAGAIACLVFSGGLAGVATLAAMGIAFSLMEANWLVFDCTWLFNKLADWQYKQPDYLPSLEEAIGVLPSASEVA